MKIIIISLIFFLINVLAAAIAFPLKTKGHLIVDNNDNRVKLACANWYGAHMKRYVVDGLDMKTLDYITS